MVIYKSNKEVSRESALSRPSYSISLSDQRSLLSRFIGISFLHRFLSNLLVISSASRLASTASLPLPTTHGGCPLKLGPRTTRRTTISKKIGKESMTLVGLKIFYGYLYIEQKSPKRMSALTSELLHLPERSAFLTLEIHRNQLLAQIPLQPPCHLISKSAVVDGLLATPNNARRVSAQAWPAGLLGRSALDRFQMPCEFTMHLSLVIAKERQKRDNPPPAQQQCQALVNGRLHLRAVPGPGVLRIASTASLAGSVPRPKSIISGAGRSYSSLSWPKPTRDEDAPTPDNADLSDPMLTRPRQDRALPLLMGGILTFSAGREGGDSDDWPWFG